MFLNRLLFTILAICPLVLVAQNTLVDSLNAFKGILQDVKVGKDNYEQNLRFDASQPYRLQLDIKEIDRRGREELTRYDFNLGLISPNRVRYEDGKNRIIVSLEGASGSTVKTYEDGELDGYEDEAYFLAANIDNARRMQQMLKAMIPIAKTRWESDNALPDTYDQLLQWMQTEVRNISIDDENWDQQWTEDPDVPTQIQLEQVEDGEETYHYSWNLADINPSDIEVDVKGKLVLLEMKTRNRKDFIQVEEDGVVDKYENEVSLWFAEVDDAQIAASALRKLVQLAGEKDKALQPTYDSQADTRRALSETITDFERGDMQITQRLKGDCQAVYEVEETEDGTKTSYVYGFDFADFDPKSIEVEIKRTALYVVADTRDRQDYVYNTEDGEQENYDDEVSFQVEDIPKAKLLRQQLMKMAESCPGEVEAKDFSWMQAQVQEIDEEKEELSQTLKLLDGEDCKWVFVRLEKDGDDTEEERYEFNLYDLDAEEVKLDISGKTVEVTVPTIEDEEIIKHYTEDDEEGYEDELVFILKDIADGKAFAASLKAMISDCTE